MKIILTGGTSLERDIAIQSARFIQKYFGEPIDMLYLPEDLDRLIELKDEIELAIPVFHGKYGEDGCIFAFLKILGIKTAFSEYQVHALCLDKYKTDTLLRAMGVQVPNEILLKKGENLDEKEINNYIGFPCILKPNNGGSSFHTYKIETFEELKEKLEFVFSEIDDDMLIGEFIEGVEYSVPFVQGEMIPVMKLEKQDESAIFDYDSKYEETGGIKETFPQISESEMKEFRILGEKIYKYFEIEGFCRIDFIKRDDDIFCIDINTIPGMTETSIIPQAWIETGRSLEEFVQKITKK